MYKTESFQSERANPYFRHTYSGFLPRYYKQLLKDETMCFHEIQIFFYIK